MQNGAILLCSSTTLVATNSLAVKGWNGGQGALVVNADNFGSTLHLELKNYSGTWVRVNTSNITANQVMALNLPAGEYRMISTSSVLNLTAVLCPTP